MAKKQKNMAENAMSSTPNNKSSTSSSTTRRREEDDVPSSSTGSSLLTKIAILGDSGLALGFSFIILIVAILVTLYVEDVARNDTTLQNSTNTAANHNNNENIPSTISEKKVGQAIKDQQRDFEARYRKLGPVPDFDPPRVYNVEHDSLHDIRQAYETDGVVAVRGLISTELLHRLDVESTQLIVQEQERKHPTTDNHQKRSKQQQSTQFHTMYQSPVFLEAPVFKENMIMDSSNSLRDNIKNLTAFLEVSTFSQVPQFSADLLSPEKLHSNDTVRLIRDIFLAKDEEEFICGWHVDDFGFWPATASSPGINAWIALDDMPATGGGGFALAVGSHRADWKEEAHRVTGATTTFPPQGFASAADMFANRTGSGTCNIKTAAPHLYRRMEETKRIYELQRGDIIFQRWLFQMTVAFERDYVAQRKDQNLLYRRYSLRFVPGSAIIPPGYGTELSVLYDASNGNRSADEVSVADGPWYPQVWPSVDAKEMMDLNDLINKKIPIAQERKLARQKEMQPFLKAAAAKQQKGMR